MIGLDTNVLVRYLVQDDAAQARAAAAGCEHTVTFDRGLKRVPHFRVL